MVDAWQSLAAPQSTIDYNNQQQQVNDISQLRNAQTQQTGVQTAGAVNDIQNKQRAMQLSMLSGVLNEQDPEKQRQILDNIVPIANRINPSYQIDPNIDVPTIRALVQSTQPLANIPDTSFINSPAGQNLNPIVKAGLQSGQMGLKDVLSAQASNPFLDIGANPPTTPISGSAGADQATGSDQAMPTMKVATPVFDMPPQVSAKISQLPPAMQPTVTAIIEGREQPPTLNSRNPGAQSLMQAVNFADPTFDFSNAQNRAKTRASFTSGPDANNITAINTAIPHIIALKNSFDQLGNGDNETANEAKNWLTRQYGSTSPLNAIAPSTQGAQAAVSTDASAVSHELAKVFRSTGMSEAEINDWQQKVATTKTPDQQKAVIGQALDLMDGRLQALGDKYSQGMGVAKNGIDLLSPTSQKAYQQLRGGDTLQPSTPQTAATQAAAGLKQPQNTPIVTTKQAFDALPSGSVYVEIENGQPVKYRKP